MCLVCGSRFKVVVAKRTLVLEGHGWLFEILVSSEWRFQVDVKGRKEGPLYGTLQALGDFAGSRGGSLNPKLLNPKRRFGED